MRKTKVKRPENEMATTARDDDQDSSLSGAPSELKWELRAKPGLKNPEDIIIRRASIFTAGVAMTERESKCRTRRKAN